MFNNSAFLVYVILLHGFYLIGEGRKHKLPDFLEPCSRSDPDLNNCIRNRIESIKPRLSKGIPELYIPPLDPLHLPMATLTENALQASFDDIKIRHLNDNEITDLKFDLEKPELALQLYIPQLGIETQYRVQGKLLILQLNGNGASNGTYSDVFAQVVMSGNRIVKNNQEYFNFDRAKVKITIKDAHIYSEGLIQDPEMNDAVNKIINENIKEFLVELMPVIEGTVEKFVLQMTKKLFASFSLDELFV